MAEPVRRDELHSDPGAVFLHSLAVETRGEGEQVECAEASPQPRPFASRLPARTLGTCWTLESQSEPLAWAITSCGNSDQMLQAPSSVKQG